MPTMDCCICETVSRMSLRPHDHCCKVLKKINPKIQQVYCIKNRNMRQMSVLWKNNSDPLRSERVNCTDRSTPLTLSLCKWRTAAVLIVVITVTGQSVLWTRGIFVFLVGQGRFEWHCPRSFLLCQCKDRLQFSKTTTIDTASFLKI